MSKITRSSISGHYIHSITSCIMRVLTPTFITESDPQITTTFFHCTCYKLLQLAIHKSTQCSRPRGMGDVTTLMLSTTLSSFVTGFVMVFMILLILSWMYIVADTCNWSPFKKNTQPKTIRSTLQTKVLHSEKHISVIKTQHKKP